jgi:hypothetical protein
MLYRPHRVNFFHSMWETIKWMPLFMIFFGGISIHLSKAVLCHFFSINMEWNLTTKELEEIGFFIGMDKIVKDFKWMYIHRRATSYGSFGLYGFVRVKGLDDQRFLDDRPGCESARLSFAGLMLERQTVWEIIWGEGDANLIIRADYWARVLRKIR